MTATSLRTRDTGIPFSFIAGSPVGSRANLASSAFDCGQLILLARDQAIEQPSGMLAAPLDRPSQRA
jgi:hypothetical protein